MTSILVGTCDNDRSAGTEFGQDPYPFPTVELNRPFSAMPTAVELRDRLERTGPSLLFSVAAHRALTHEVVPAARREGAEAFLRAIEPLLETQRLAAALFPFPPRFLNTEANRRYLSALLDDFSGVPVALEFAHAGWYTNAVVDICRSREVAIVSADLPDLPGLPPLVDVATAPFAYFRCHGRNGAAWAGGDARCDYSYSDAELGGLAERVRGIAPQVKRVFVYFNNSGMAADALNFAARVTRGGRMP